MNWHKLVFNNADTLQDLLITEEDTIVTVLYKPLMEWYKRTRCKPNKRYIRAGKALVLSKKLSDEMGNESMTWVMQRGAYMPIPTNCIEETKGDL